MNVVVLVKQVPDTWSERKLSADTGVLDRDSADAVIDEIDTRGVETALQLVEQHGGEVTVLTMGPERAAEALRKALAMGAHRAVHVQDPGLAGTCALQTSSVLAAALSTLSPDLVVVGNQSTDGAVGAMAAMLAERLSWAQLTSVRTLTITNDVVSAERVDDHGYAEITATLPAIVSITEKINEPRYPSFKGIMAAKKKPLSTLTASDIGIDAAAVGHAGSSTRILLAEPRPPKSGGRKIVDDGTGATEALDFLTSARLV